MNVTINASPAPGQADPDAMVEEGGGSASFRQQRTRVELHELDNYVLLGYRSLDKTANDGDGKTCPKNKPRDHGRGVPYGSRDPCTASSWPNSVCKLLSRQVCAYVGT
jgi:hypothetical protein